MTSRPADLVVVDLDPLPRLRDRWAAASAVLTALGSGSVSGARDVPAGRLWTHDDGGGDIAQLVVLGPGLAVLSGWDREHSLTRLQRGGDGAPTGELVAGTPEWWALGVPAEGDVGFVYGSAGDRWLRAPYDVPDGFAGLDLPAAGDAALYGLVDSYVECVADDQGLGEWRAPRVAVDALGRAGTGLTRADLTAVLGPLRADLDAGVAAARAFSPGAVAG